MSAEDQVVLNALKAAAKAGPSNPGREKAKSLAEKALSSLKVDAARTALSKTVEYLLVRARMAEIGKPAIPPFIEIAALSRAGFARSAEFAWTELGDAIHDYPAADLVACAPSIRVLDLIAKKNHELAESALFFVEEQPDLADSSAALDWLVARARPKEMSRLIPHLLVERQRSPHLASSAELLGAALLRDKTGALFRELMAGGSGVSSLVTERLLAAVRGSPKLLAQFLRDLPKLLLKSEASMAVSFFDSLLADFPKTPLKAREEISGSVAGLAAHLLKNRKRKTAEQLALDCLGRHSRKLLTSMDATKDFAEFWLIGPAAELASFATAGGANISIWGANLLTDAIGEARDGLPAESLLEALALNLGMVRIGKLGERVDFDVKIHEDSVGGLIQGDTAIVSQSGWRLGERVISRCKVSPKEP